MSVMAYDLFLINPFATQIWSKIFHFKQEFNVILIVYICFNFQEKERQKAPLNKSSFPTGDINSVGLPNPDEIEDLRIFQQFR